MEPNELFKLRNNMLSATFNPTLMDLIGKQAAYTKSTRPFDFFTGTMATLQPALDAAAKMAAVTTRASSVSFLHRMFSPIPITEPTKAAKYYATLRMLDLMSKNIANPWTDTHHRPWLSEIYYQMPEVAMAEDVREEIEINHALNPVVNESQQIKRIILDIYNSNSSLLDLQPRAFEKLIAELLSGQGFKVELTKQTRDGGFDILAILPVKSHMPLKYLVECKRFAENRKVSIDIIRSFKEVVESENANRGIIATTSYFTVDAKSKQKETPYLLDFRDKDAVMEWVGEYATTSRPFH